MNVSLEQDAVRGQGAIKHHNRLRIVVHDYCGHPFPVQLSRNLAKRGHYVLHLHSTYVLPRAALEKSVDDPDNLFVSGVGISKTFRKYSLVKRRFQDIEYGHNLAAEVEEFRPDVVISANAPLDAQAIIIDTCRRHSIKFIIWLQDLLSVGIQRFLTKKLPCLGAPITQHYLRLERRLLRKSDAVVLITKDFAPILTRWSIANHKLHVIENWAPLSEIRSLSKQNSWANAQGVADKTCFLYSGTLGHKHNPQLLIDLAEHMRKFNHVRVMVVSEGLGADWLKYRKEKLSLSNLILLPYQPYDRLSEVFSSGDILIAILEPDAGVFSVPSKILSYFCAGRPVLAAIPSENQAAKIIIANQVGRLVQPTDPISFVAAAEELLCDEAARIRFGANALAYAAETFDIDIITDRFEGVFQSALS